MKKEDLENFLSSMMKAKTRNEKWDFLYETEYADDSLELNEAMVRMTDAEVEEWFPKICTDFLFAQIAILDSK